MNQGLWGLSPSGDFSLSSLPKDSGEHWGGRKKIEELEDEKRCHEMFSFIFFLNFSSRLFKH